MTSLTTKPDLVGSSCSSNSTTTATNVVRVGVGVIVLDENQQIYAGIRCDPKSHGYGQLALPGGHLELYETWEECALREVQEEMGYDFTTSSLSQSTSNINITSNSTNTIIIPTYLGTTNDIMKEYEKHYITIFMMLCLPRHYGLPKNMEPHKCEGWKTYSWNSLVHMSQTNPNHMFRPLLQLVQNPPHPLLQALGIASSPS